MSLLDKKKTIARQFMGVAGINSIGCSEEKGRINIYAKDVSSDEFIGALEEILKIAAPHRVKCEKMGAPRFA